MKKLAKFIGYILPKIRTSTLPSGLGTKYDMLEVFKNDPLTYTGGVVPGTIRSVLLGVEEVNTLFTKLTTPWICFAAGVEKMTHLFSPL